jgi:hypothetical protein
MSENLEHGVKMVLKKSLTGDSYGAYLVYPSEKDGEPVLETYIGVADEGLENSGKYEVILNGTEVLKTPEKSSSPLPEEDNSLLGSITNVFSNADVSNSKDFGKAIGNVAASLTDVINGSDETSDLLTKLFGSKIVAEMEKRKKIQDFFKEELNENGVKATIAKVKKEFDIPEDYEIDITLKVKFSAENI